LLTLHAPDLTIVEEMDTQIDLQAAPATPTHTQLEQSIAYRSPGAASEMSGTTAISSFTMIEAEFLEPKYILKHMRKLCDSSREFLDHLAPENGGIDADLRNIQEMQKPESDFNDEYRDFDDELNVHLKHYKSEEHSYIHVRAIHRALFDGNYDAAATQTGIDLILYLANLLIFAKQMIHSDRTEKGIWDALRQLDNVFPSQFMRSLEPETKPTIAGESTMLQETFELALELRTQLAILVLERSALDSSFNPDEAIQEVFFQSESSQEMGSSIIRGWNVEALGGEDFALPKRFENIVIERLHKIRESFLLDDESLARGDLVNTEKLNASFLWTPTIMRLLSWVRLRHKELSTTIDDLGGAAAILRNVKQELREPQTITKQTVVKSAQLGSPRKKRRSFGRDRRRSSRKFDPNAAVDLHAIDALKARERLSGASTAVHTQEDFSTQYVAEEEQGELPIINEQQDQSQPVLEVEEERRVEQVEVTVEEQARGEAVEGEAEEQTEKEAEGEPTREAEEEKQEPNPEPAGPPSSAADLLKALKTAEKPGKENRTSIFERQSGAQRVEFGDGFDTQPTSGPSNRDKGKQRAQPSSNRKRPRPVEDESESEEDAFETEDRTARVHERRQKAPVAKKVRIDPTSSAAPTSHQPPSLREVDDDYVPGPNQEESLSENEAPDMTEEAPPSTYQNQLRLAKQNNAMPRRANKTDRKPRTDWTTREEDAFAEYMALYPAKYAAILRHDKVDGYKILQERTQVNLKDKARTMAINMIKYVSAIAYDWICTNVIVDLALDS
jgi:hypothetical protein